MIRYEHTVMIPGSVSQVFAYAADYRKWPDWFVGVSDVEPITPIDRGNGARYSYKVRMWSIPARVETEIHDFEEDAGWTGVGVKGVPHRTRWIFESVDQNTRFTYGLEGRLPVPLLGPLFDPLLGAEWKKIIGQSLENLRRHFLAGSGTESQ